jgi:hypothetical protein
VDNLDDARALDLIAGWAVPPILLLCPSALSSSAVSGLRWPRREVTGYSQRRCLLAHWLVFFLRYLVVVFFLFIFHLERWSVRRGRGKKGNGGEDRGVGDNRMATYAARTTERRRLGVFRH